MITTGTNAIQFIVDKGTDKSYEITLYAETRSKKINRYFHRLVGLLSAGEGTKLFKKKNEIILQYGNQKLERTPDGKPLYEILPDNDDYLHHPTKHYVPTDFVDDFCGVRSRAFCLLRGTHTYSNAEMVRLVELTREECIGCGIPKEEVETPEERRLLEDMKRGRKSKDIENDSND